VQSRSGMASTLRVSTGSLSVKDRTVVVFTAILRHAAKAAVRQLNEAAYRTLAFGSRSKFFTTNTAPLVFILKIAAVAAIKKDVIP
jgi:hypothetical protein